MTFLGGSCGNSVTNILAMNSYETLHSLHISHGMYKIIGNIKLIMTACLYINGDKEAIHN